MAMVRRDRSRGQSLVEFAIILPVFILVLVGILDLGRAVYAYNTLNNAAREGSRLAIVDQTEADIQAFAAQQAGWIGVPPTDVIVDFRAPATPNIAGSCDANVGTNAVVGCLAVVRVEWGYFAATPIINGLVGTIEMAGESRLRVENNCLETVPGECPDGD